MTTQPQDPKARSIELLEHLVDASDAQTLIISDLVNEVRALLETFAKLAQVLSQPPAPAAAPAQPASAAAPAHVQDFTASAVIMTYNDKGEPAYKIVGFPFSTFGVRVWPEVLPALGNNPDQLKPGPNPFTAQVRALMVESGTTGKLTPKKIMGLTPTNGG